MIRLPNALRRPLRTALLGLLPVALLVSGCSITVGSPAATPTLGPGEPTNTPIDQVHFDITPVASPTLVPPTPVGATAVPGGGGTGATGKYTIKPGDTLSGIALQFGITVAELVKLNNIADPNAVQAGQVLIVPVKGAAPPATARPAATATKAP